MINFYEGKNSYIKNDFQKDINDLYIHLYKIVLIEIFFFFFFFFKCYLSNLERRNNTK